MFSITQYGKELDKSKYSWNEETKTLTTKENNLVLDFSDYDKVTFNTGYSCTFKTGHSCAFNTGNYCTFTTGHYCTFNTGSYCAFNTGYSCTLKTGEHCTLKTGSNCIFYTGSSCTLKTGHNCIFYTGHSCIFYTGSSCTLKTGSNCVAIRFDVEGITEIPKDITITFNSSGVSGYTKVQENKPNPCNGKVVEVDGKKYKLQEIS
jgi:hypothetical protein